MGQQQGVCACGAVTSATLLGACRGALGATPAVIRAELNLVGLAMRAERKVIDKIVDGLKFHS
jgi:hypothetical protein